MRSEGAWARAAMGEERGGKGNGERMNMDDDMNGIQFEALRVGDAMHRFDSRALSWQWE